jgi:hypothetical protein
LAGGVSAWFSKTRCGPHGAFLGRSSMFRTGPPLGGSVTYKVFFGTSSHVDPVFAKGESAREVARPTLVQHPQVRRSATPWCRRCLGGSASPPSCCRGRPWRCRMPIDVRPCRLLHLHKWFPSGPLVRRRAAKPRPSRQATPRVSPRGVIMPRLRRNVPKRRLHDETGAPGGSQRWGKAAGDVSPRPPLLHRGQGGA